MAKVGVLGAGSWGTALAILLHDNGHDVTVWSIDPKEARSGSMYQNFRVSIFQKRL